LILVAESNGGPTMMARIGVMRARWRAAMLDRDTKELLIGWGAILIFAVAIVYLRQ
jgi:hypothetical protein